MTQMTTPRLRRTPPTEGNLPQLRFPEFKDAGAWEGKKFSNLYTFKVTNSFSRDKLSYESGIVKNIHYGDIHTKFSTLFDITKESVPYVALSESIEKIKEDCYCQEGDMVFADASEDMEDVGKSIEIVRLNNQKLLSGLHTLLARQINNTFIIGFGGYLFKSDNIRAQIKRESQGAKVLGISAGRLSNIKITFPANQQEQQKIAACLSSLDDLITTENQQLEALKTHKKGLMQSLFSAEGETVPKHRFPEFKDAGVWEEKRLGDLFNFLRGSLFSKVDIVQNGVHKCIHYGELFTTYKEKISEIKSSTNLENGQFSQKNDILMPSSDVTPEGLATASAIFEDGIIIGGDVNILRPKKEVNSLFVSYFLNFSKKEIMKLVSGTTVKHIYNKDISTLRLKLPSTKEQQKIAACLSSLDDLISAQSQKIEALKQHKKGLMQQLFPNSPPLEGWQAQPDGVVL